MSFPTIAHFLARLCELEALIYTHTDKEMN